MQRKTNIRLLIVLGVLLSGIVLIQFSNGNKDNLGVDKKLFQLDPQREINQVILQGPTETNRFDFREGRWHLNDSLFLDQSMRDVFFSVVSQLEIRRPVLKTQADSIAGILRDTGVLTTISFGDEQIQQYRVGGNSQQQVSWIIGEDAIPYEIHLPGYQSYVAGIFHVPATDWRSRFLLNVNFALLKTIEMTFVNNKENLRLNFEENFFTIPGVKADSLKIANYLEAVSFLQATSFVNPEEADKYHNEAKLQRVAELKLYLLNGNTFNITFFEDPQDDKIYLTQLANGTLAKISRRAVNELLKNPADFE